MVGIFFDQSDNNFVINDDFVYLKPKFSSKFPSQISRLSHMFEILTHPLLSKLYMVGFIFGPVKRLLPVK